MRRHTRTRHHILPHRIGAILIRNHRKLNRAITRPGIRALIIRVLQIRTEYVVFTRHQLGWAFDDQLRVDTRIKTVDARIVVIKPSAEIGRGFRPRAAQRQTQQDNPAKQVRRVKQARGRAVHGVRTSRRKRGKSSDFMPGARMREPYDECE